jgi:hypothetical protein
VPLAVVTITELVRSRIEVDPNNPDRVFFDTFDIWLANRTGTAWYDVSCGYSGVSPKPFT